MITTFTDVDQAIEEADYRSQTEYTPQAICSHEVGYSVLPLSQVDELSGVLEVIRS